MDDETLHDDSVALLLSRVKPRAALPPVRAARLKADARGRWRHQVERRRRRRRSWQAGGLLATAAALIVVLRFSPAARTTAPVAHLEKSSATVHLLRDDRAATGLETGDEIRPGDRVETAGGPAALRLADGASLRLDAGARLRLVSASLFDLERGTVYLDAEGAAGLEVRTGLGSVRDVGTQFEVHLGDGALRVRVREGRVELGRRGSAWEGRAGEELVLDAEGRLRRRPVPVYGPLWDWVLEAAPDFVLEGRTLGDYLAWVTRETGRKLRTGDDVDEEDVLHGSVEGMPPERTLAVVLPASGLEHRVEEGNLIIEVIEGANE